jgi:hypothetical protein
MISFINKFAKNTYFAKGEIRICNLSQELKMILIALGPAWCRYFNTDYYEQVIF